MKYGKSKVLICEIMGICQDILKRVRSKRPTCQKLAFRKWSLRYQPSYALMTPYKPSKFDLALNVQT